MLGGGSVGVAGERVAGHEDLETGIVIPRPQVQQPGRAVKLLAGKAIHCAAGSGLGQYVAVRFVSGHSLDGVVRHLLTDAA